MNKKLIPTSEDTPTMRDYKLYSQSVLEVKNACSTLWGAVNVMDARLEQVMKNEHQQHLSSKRLIKGLFENELALFPEDKKQDNADEIAGQNQVGKYRQKLNPTDRLVLKELSRGHFVAMPTIAGSIGRGRLTVAESIKVLRNLNYNVITKSVSGSGRRYRKIYKVEGKRENA